MTLIGMPEAWNRVARDYRRHILPDFLPAARALCRTVGIHTGDQVLDVACGPGTAAIAAGELGAARVVGLDYAQAMVAVAREETTTQRADFSYAVANALALPFTSGAFDVVVSSFGLIFAPDPIQAVREAARVLRARGRLGLLAWPPDGSIGAYQATAFRHLAVPPSSHNPFEWGLPTQAGAWLDGAFTAVRMQPLEVPFEAASPADAWRILRTATGRVAAAFAKLDAAGQRRLDREMEAFFEPFRLPDGRVRWPREAFIITASKS
ncbi:MAG TPA: methyltransferase domain-containing protein [Gemmatimonadales bacterium]|nr:methyltransferase domain-containing protein [Gemmatimonadales bacterium]